MSFFYKDTRELKSLKLFNKTKNLEDFFSYPKTCGIIISCPGLHAKERLILQEQFLKQDLKISKISNKLIRILCKNNTKNYIQDLNNLLRGSLFLLESNSIDNNLFSTSNINNMKLILNQKQFTLRFLLWNQHLYRRGHFLHTQEEDFKPSKKIVSTIKHTTIYAYNLMYVFLYLNIYKTLALVKKV